MLLGTLSGHAASIGSLAFSPDGSTLASLSNDHNLRLWDANTKLLRRNLSPSSKFTSFGFAPDGSKLAAGCDNSTLIIFDPQDGGQLLTLHPEGDHVQKVSFSPDGSKLFLCLGKADARLQLFDAASGTLVNTLPITSLDPFGALALHSPVERKAAIFISDLENPVDGKSKYIRLIDTETGDGLYDLTQSRGNDGCDAAFSSDGKMLVSSDVIEVQIPYDMKEDLWSWSQRNLLSNIGEVCVWAVESGELLWCRDAHTSVASVCFSPDGSIVASGEKTLKQYTGYLAKPGEAIPHIDTTALAEVILWEAATGKSIARLELPEGKVISLAFSPDGKILATAVSVARDLEEYYQLRDEGLGHHEAIYQSHNIYLWDVETLLSKGEVILSTSNFGATQSAAGKLSTSNLGASHSAEGKLSTRKKIIFAIAALAALFIFGPATLLTYSIIAGLCYAGWKVLKDV